MYPTAGCGAIKTGVDLCSICPPSCTFLQDKNAAECDCYEIDENSPGADTNPYSFVLMTGILNKQVYENTVAACGPDGSLCLNLSDTNSGLMEAPVCDALWDKTLFSGADLFSDFSQITIPPNSRRRLSASG